MAPTTFLWVSTWWGASSSRSGLACSASNSSTAGTFVPLKLRQTHEVSTQFHNLGFRKTKFLSSPSKQLHIFMVVLEPTISCYFSAIDVDSVPHFSTMRFLIYDANSASKCCRDDEGVASALGLSLRHLLVLESTTKLKTEKPDYQPSRKNLDCAHEFPSCSFLETSICVNA